MMASGVNPVSVYELFEIKYLKDSRPCTGPAGSYMFKVSNRNTRTRREMCSS